MNGAASAHLEAKSLRKCFGAVKTNAKQKRCIRNNNNDEDVDDDDAADVVGTGSSGNSGVIRPARWRF